MDTRLHHGYSTFTGLRMLIGNTNMQLFWSDVILLAYLEHKQGLCTTVPTFNMFCNKCQHSRTPSDVSDVGPSAGRRIRSMECSVKQYCFTSGL